jgi:hypothetical protein
MPGKFQTGTGTNDVLRTFLEFIVLVPLGKHETVTPPRIRSHSRTVMRYSFRYLTQAPGQGSYILC